MSIITRTGDGLTTDYDTDTGNQEPVTSDAMVEFTKKKINLEALFDGGDPFSTSGSSPDAQNSGSGLQKFADAASNLPRPNQSVKSISPDIQEMADRIENGEENPF